MANKALIALRRTRVTAATVPRLPSSPVRIRMRLEGSCVAYRAFYTFRRPGMATITMLYPPADTVRINMNGLGVTVTKHTLVPLGASVMALGAMLVQPTRAVRIGMRADIRLVACAASTAHDIRRVTLVAMFLLPVGIMRPRPDFIVTALTGIFFVTQLTLGPVPSGIYTVRLDPPDGVVRGRLSALMTFPASFLIVTHPAGCLRGISSHTMPLLPGLAMAGRPDQRIHIDVTVLARLRALMGFLPDPQLLRPRHFRHSLRTGREDAIVAIGTILLQQRCVRENSYRNNGWLGILGTFAEVLLFMAISACLEADLICINHVSMTLSAGLVIRLRKSTCLNLSMACITFHSIVFDMQRVTERETELVLLQAPRKGQNQNRTENSK